MHLSLVSAITEVDTRSPEKMCSHKDECSFRSHIDYALFFFDTEDWPYSFIPARQMLYLSICTLYLSHFLLSVHVCVCSYICAGLCACWGQRWMHGEFLNCLSLHFLRKNLPLILAFIYWAKTSWPVGHIDPPASTSLECPAVPRFLCWVLGIQT